MSHTSASYAAPFAATPSLTYFSRMGPASTTVDITKTPPGLSTRATSANPRLGSGQQCAPAEEWTASTEASAKGISPTSARTAAKAGRGGASGSGRTDAVTTSLSSCSAARLVIASLTSVATSAS